jgi:ABC-2 type transport system permease protein
LVFAIHLGVGIEGRTLVESVTQVLRDTLEFKGDPVNGYMVTRIILQSLYIYLPFLITLVGGDLLAGEATSGTYRLLLVRPPSRFKIVMSKYLAGVIYVFSIMLFLAIISLGFGLLLFGTGDMMIVRFNITFIESSDVLWRYGYAFLFSFLGMWVVYNISFMFSAFVENSIGPIFSTIAILIIFNIIGLISVGVFENIQPFLFTNHINTWRDFFTKPIYYNDIYTSVAVLVGHIIVITSITFIHFIRKDINS